MPLRGTHGFARSFETVVLVDDARLSEGGIGLVRSAYGTFQSQCIRAGGDKAGPSAIGDRVVMTFDPPHWPASMGA